jgi:ATP-dependent exoDNAse (exonuclease V) alpha subunit
LALIDGQAGTGKSFTMAAIRHVYEAQGYKVVGLAPTNAVAQDMQQEGFASARTVHSELFSLNNGRTQWDTRTVIMVDEAAMIDTRNMAMLTTHAHAAGAKLILVGDDRQLSSIERGGMFGVLKDRYGAAELAVVRRQHKHDDRRAAELMAEGNFHTALEIYDAKRAIQWTRTQPEARAALVAQWAEDSAANPTKSRFVFAYTNEDVDRLNRAIREMRKERGELESKGHKFETRHGPAEFSTGDRIQFTGTDKPKGLLNGQAGTVLAIEGSNIKVALDGRGHRVIEFDAAEFEDFRHGYAGTIYRGQGRTLDQTYLYHSEHWRSAASYVALTRHRDKAELFVATNTAADLKQLARQMARVDERRAASHFHHANERDPVRPLTPRELAARLGDPVVQAMHDREKQRREEESKSIEPSLTAESTASRDARDIAKHARSGEGEGSQRRLQRLLDIKPRDDSASRGSNQTGRSGGGRSRSR